ncbi:uroporphyrinogen-III C-methyltransferase [Desulforhabdus amnigena]|uniref:uroporphyrinogen-III C-methyltransferase n=1 Tax=Desulforhabdus amnigena TaxID=40218 RepID=A0A9W6FWH2_9BACT|nr:uroporphyrinogen-III C-methyltransferase [Desulforhabdus amnigena]NLJ29854.1 uroporphyrinogen-III C-methyltransferase [Deltaproteobacteria bacterium]GLI36275.1 uroporphyrinogen III methyltransferase [Desulforhabdus amnigena]
MGKGKVYLVGAGPGDPGLLTLRAKELLEQAEVVIYDYLANVEFLKYAPPEAERIYVGKKGGDHTLSQWEINDLLVKKGRDNIVVRLKGGDPFVFGRGGEEAQVLVTAGIPFEVVPGITAAIAVPAYAGIPLSHRDHTASMAFVTGHEREDAEDSKIEWEKLAMGVGTLVFFMGVKNLPQICRNLIENGRAPDTPVAVIRWGTTPDQKTVTGTLETIVEAVRQAGLKPPAITVVGGVVQLRNELNWFENRPLFGRRIVVTRAREQASDFKSILSKLGAHCIEFPTIEIQPPFSWEPLDNAISRLSTYDWAIFTSVNGVKFFMERLWAAGHDVRELKGVRLATIGPKTSEALEKFGLRPDLVPTEYRAESVLEGLAGEDLAGKRFLMPRALVARDILPRTLCEKGAQVDVVPAYQTVLPEHRSEEILDRLRRSEIHCVTFTSSSTVANFFSLFQREEILPLLRKTAVACIGPITAQTAEEHGLATDIMPSEYTIEGLVQSIRSYFESKGKP